MKKRGAVMPSKYKKPRSEGGYPDPIPPNFNSREAGLGTIRKIHAGRGGEGAAREGN